MNRVTGLHKGFPDLICFIPCWDNKMRLVCIEMKKPELKPKRGGKGGVKQEQLEWIKALQECEEVDAYVAWGANEAIEYIESLMK